MNTSQPSESSVLQAVRVLDIQLDPGMVLVYNDEAIHNAIGGIFYPGGI